MRVLVARRLSPPFSHFFFFNDTATTEIYTLSLHDALPIFAKLLGHFNVRGFLRVFSGHLDAPTAHPGAEQQGRGDRRKRGGDRKSTRLNSSHLGISYAVFCLKKKHYAYRSESVTWPRVSGA